MSVFAFDPDRVAELEAEGWRAYYDHRWLHMMRLMARMSREQFHMPFLASLAAAYDTVQAGRRWAPANSDFGGAKEHLAKFYRLAMRYSHLQFDPNRAAELELTYWDVARRLKQGAPREDFVRAMTQLHAEVFGLTPEQAAASAELRVQANELVNQITQKTAEDPERNWSELKEKLRQCYQSIHTVLHEARTASV